MGQAADELNSHSRSMPGEGRGQPARASKSTRQVSKRAFVRKGVDSLESPIQVDRPSWCDLPPP